MPDLGPIDWDAVRSSLTGGAVQIVAILVLAGAPMGGGLGPSDGPGPAQDDLAADAG